MPNTQAIDTTIAYIRAYPKRFNMALMLEKHPCGTVGCIAGTAAWVSDQLPTEDLEGEGWYDGEVVDTAKAFLDISDAQASELFFMKSVTDDLGGFRRIKIWQSVTSEQAIGALEILRNDGTFCWAQFI